MLRRLGFGLLAGGAGYLLGTALGIGLVYQFSPNLHDLDLEAAMTGFFVAGPLGAFAGFALGWWRGRPRR